MHRPQNVRYEIEVQICATNLHLMWSEYGIRGIFDSFLCDVLNMNRFLKKYGIVFHNNLKRKCARTKIKVYQILASERCRIRKLAQLVQHLLVLQSFDKLEVRIFFETL